MALTRYLALLHVAFLLALVIGMVAGCSRSKKPPQTMPYEVSTRPGENAPEYRSLVMTDGFPSDAEDDPATERDERYDSLAINDIRRLEADYLTWAIKDREEGIMKENNPETIPFSMGGLVPDNEFFGGAGEEMEGGSGIPKKEPQGKIRVWYGTNRALRDPTNPELGYSNQRESDANRLHLGSVICEVPRNREVGSVGSSWLVRKLSGVDDRIKIEKIFLEQEGAFYKQLSWRLKLANPGERDILVYIHGYKNSFESAAIRAAQLAVDLNVPGLTAFYSWPSADTISEYTADEAAVETSEKHLATFLTRIAGDTGAENVHIIAHSMGNRVVTRVMQRLASQPTVHGKPPVKFGQIILAAPDIDTQVFADLAAAYPALSERTTLYISQRDKALEASSWTHSFPRAGYGPPISILPDIDTVEVTNIDVSTLGHGYVAEQEHVLFDIAMMLRKDTPPSVRPRLTPTRTSDGRQYWTVHERAEK
jgi:esterase/lipase superfamily enzyme